MHGLEALPQIADLKNAYEKLQFHIPTPPTEKELALYSQWARFDARLGEIWIDHLANDWKKLNPISLNEELLRLPWPAAAGVLLEFVSNKIRDRSVRDHLLTWMHSVLYGIKPAPFQMFYISGRKPGSPSMLEDSELPLQEYRRWGFLARDSLVGKQSFDRGELSPDIRKKYLKKLCSSRMRIDLDTYWNEIGKVISRRQAERDLRECAWLKPVGNTRARQYLVTRTEKRNRKAGP